MADPEAEARHDHSDPAEAGSIPAVVVHGAEHARLVLRAAAGRPVWLLSAPGAASYGGAAWFLAACRDAGATDGMVLDCADAPGRVLQAFRAGLRRVVFTGGPAMAERLALVAEEAGSVLLRARPPALDMADPGAVARLDAWLAQGLGG